MSLYETKITTGGESIAAPAGLPSTHEQGVSRDDWAGGIDAARFALMGAGLEPDGVFYDPRHSYTRGTTTCTVNCVTSGGDRSPVDVTFTGGVYTDFRLLKH